MSLQHNLPSLPCHRTSLVLTFIFIKSTNFPYGTLSNALLKSRVSILPYCLFVALLFNERAITLHLLGLISDFLLLVYLYLQIFMFFLSFKFPPRTLCSVESAVAEVTFSTLNIAVMFGIL